MQTTSAGGVRRWEREPVAIPVGLVVKADQRKSDTFTDTINISLSGVGVRTTLALVPKQEVAIIIKGQFSHTVAARVAWVRQDAFSNSMLAGLKFLL